MTAKLEDLKVSAIIRGIVPDAAVTVVSVQWYGSEALELTYKTATGKVANQLLYRDDEPRLEIVEQGRPWSFDGDGALFHLVSETQRIRLGHVFNPVLVVHTSMVNRCRIRLLPSTSRCSRVSRSVSCWRTIRVPARRFFDVLM